MNFFGAFCTLFVLPEGPSFVHLYIRRSEVIFDWRVFACYTQWGGYNSVSWFYDIGISMQKKFGWTREKGEIPGAQKICGLLEVVKKGKKAKYSGRVLLTG